ncbi:cold-shock protein [Kitasatospora sp. NPDC098663]|uniref:cold-shock protein n=1 Tax=Kitasatospora sp. NPDC098663 TaxID=3364096 RepID=UPI0038246D13
MKSFNDKKGYGLITPDAGGDELFVSFDAIVGSGRARLFEGQRVTFEVEVGQKGSQATGVLSE